MPTLCTLVRRDSTPGQSADKDSSNGPIIIAGITFCVVVVVGVVVWLAIRTIRRRNRRKLEDERSAAFLTVRGIVKENGTPGESVEKATLPVDVGALHNNGFSRNQFNPSVVMPDKVLSKPPVSKEDIIESHRQTGNLPKPFSFALNASHSVNPSVDSQKTTNPRASFMSISSSYSGRRFSVMSASSAASSLSSGNARKIRQQFEPVLPDELLVTLNERLTVIESFDDGWCLVGRDNSPFASAARSLFAPKSTSDSNVELGVVPAWCFIQSVKGLRTERPVRSSSLGITVQLDSPAASRGDVISWSNF